MILSHPPAARFEPAVVIRDALAAKLDDQRVMLDRDATYQPSVTATVVTAAARPLAQLPAHRWAFSVDITLATTAADTDAVLDAAYTAADALLSITSYDGVMLSSVKATGEPRLTGTHNPSGAAMAAATFTAIMRRERTQQS